MSTLESSTSAAPVFAALGDPTRLQLVGRLSAGKAQSITHLCGDLKISRQAVSKHLVVLESAGVVRSERVGRENRYALEPDTVQAAQTYLAGVSAQWDSALARLQQFLEP